MSLTRNQKIGIVGGCMFFFSILFQTAIFPVMLKAQVRKKIALKRGWIMRDLWSKIPFAIDYHFYIFNITNPIGITNGEKPIVREVGPFLYDEWHEKTNQMDHEEDDTVSYTVRNTYYFNAKKSIPLTGEEVVTVPSYFALGLVNSVMRQRPTALPIVAKAIESIEGEKRTIFIKAKIRDILFDGLIINCNVTDFAGSAVCSEVKARYKDLRLKQLEENIYSMSLWGAFNATDSKARTRVYRGIQNFMDVGTVVEYNNKPNLSIWNDDYCDKFNGTDGTIFHPFFDKRGRDDLVAFNPTLCRSISCHYDSKTSFAGMKLLRYTADLGTDGENNPLHECYCMSPDSCLRKGAYDLFKCLGVPLIVTNPHFYLADPYYISTVRGLKPIKEKHMIAVDLDPFTGAPLHVHTRAQFNMFITKTDKFKPMKDFPDALLPLLWIDEFIVLPNYLIKEIKMGHILYILGKIFQYLMMIGGLGMIVIAAYKQYEPACLVNKLDLKKIILQGRVNGQSNNIDNKDPTKTTTLQSHQTAPIPASVD